jgi:hypothetical protein
MAEPFNDRGNILEAELDPELLEAEQILERIHSQDQRRQGTLAPTVMQNRRSGGQEIKRKVTL